jgi:hypothetical protein
VGCYVIPELRKANSSVWVRGYGLVDSANVKATLGQHRDLTATVAPSAAAAAEYYPGLYWVFDASDPGQKPVSGNGRER